MLETGIRLVAAAAAAVSTEDIRHLIVSVSRGSSITAVCHTVSLVVSLTETTAVALIVLAEALLGTILRVVSLLVVLLLWLLLLLLLLLLVLRHETTTTTTVRLSRLEGLSAGLKCRCPGVEATALRLGRILRVHVELLLRLARQVVVLRSGVIFPRVEIRHDEDMREIVSTS